MKKRFLFVVMREPLFAIQVIIFRLNSVPKYDISVARVVGVICGDPVPIY